MELLAQLPTFIAAVALISAVPGPAVALLIRRCSVSGFAAGVPIVLGLETGPRPAHRHRIPLTD